MKPGQVLTQWWQDYVAGRLRTPQCICRAAHAENPLPDPRFLQVPPDTAQWDAPRRLKAPGWFTHESYLKQSRRADFAHTDPRLTLWAMRFVEDARKREIPLYVHTALRGEAEQNRVNAAGNSKAAYPMSAHNIGEAVDIVHGVFHWEMTRDEWAMLHTLGRLTLDRVNATLKKADKLDLTWGGDFKSLYDPAHWEITSFRQRRRMLAAVPPVHHSPREYFARGNHA